MLLQVLYFARTAEITAKKMEEIECDGFESLMNALYTRYPLLKESNFMLAVNCEYCHTDGTLLDGSRATLKDGDEIALIAPVSGG